MISLGVWRTACARQVLVLWSVVALALMPMGCADRANNSDAESPIAVTSGGIEILEVARNEGERTVEATIVAAAQERQVTIIPLADGPLPSGIVSTIADADGRMLFELSVAIDERTGAVWYRERTESDVLTGSIRNEAGRVFETYEINGDRFEVDYPFLPAEQMEKAYARYRAGGLGNAVTADLREINDKLTAFAAFYVPFATNSLHHNADGELLVSLLGDPQFAGVVTGNEVDPLKLDTPSQRACWLAATCVGMKCRLGGIANPLCVSCAGTFVTCIIAEIACWFIGCDCCF